MNLILLTWLGEENRPTSYCLPVGGILPNTGPIDSWRLYFCWLVWFWERKETQLVFWEMVFIEIHCYLFSSQTSKLDIWDRFHEKGPSAYIIKFPVHTIQMSRLH